MGIPQLCVGNVDDAAPKIRLSQMLLPIAEMLAIKRSEFWCHPRFCVNAVRDIGDRHFRDWNTRPDIFPKRTSHVTVQFTHAIRVAAETQRQDGHAERLVRVESCVAE